MVSRLDTQTNIRLPGDLKKSLVDAAAENRRSLSAEIEARLAESFSGQSGAAGAALVAERMKFADEITSLHKSMSIMMHQLHEERSRNDRWSVRLFEVLKDAVRGLDEALLLARYKNAAEADLLRLQQELNTARASIDSLRQLLPTRDNG